MFNFGLALSPICVGRDNRKLPINTWRSVLFCSVNKSYFETKYILGLAVQSVREQCVVDMKMMRERERDSTQHPALVLLIILDF